MLLRLLLPALLVFSPLWADEGKVKTLLDLPDLAAAREEPPAGYLYRVTEMLHLAAVAHWDPSIPELTVHQTLVFRNIGNADAPLKLLLDHGTYRISPDSLRFRPGLDSTYTLSDGFLFFARPSAAGVVDTLELYYRSRRDRLGALDSLRYPPGRRFCGLSRWLALPEYAQGLWPSELTISAPDSLTVVASGELTGSTPLGGGRTAHHWRMTRWSDISVIEIGSFDSTELDSAGVRVRLLHHGRPDSTVRAFAGWAARALALYTEWFGPPPYPALWVMEVPELYASGGAVPGVIFLNKNLFDKPYQGPDPANTFFTEKTVFHEIAHQWWSGLVQSIEHRPMTEAITEYCAIDAVCENPLKKKIFLRSYILSQLKGALGSPYDKPLTDRTGGLYYYKGPWVAHMLEETVGREAFRAALRSLLQEFSYRDATLDDLFAALARYYAGDLSWFRREWFERAGWPVLELSRRLEREGDGYKLTVAVSQKGTPFRVPLELGVYLPGGQEILHTLELTGAADTLRLSLAGPPDSVLADPHIRLLSDNRWVTLGADILRLAENPNSGGPFEVNFYLDSTLAYNRIRLFHDCRAAGEWDSLALDPDSLRRGYGRAFLPAASPGRNVGFYFEFQDEYGIDYTFPAGAPADSVFHFRVTGGLPDPLRQGYFTFRDNHFLNMDTTRDAFRERYEGLAGFNLQTRERFGVLYGAGNLAPRYDQDRGRLITVNERQHSVDVMDLAAWRLEKRIPLPEGFNWPYRRPFSALNRSRGIYYLMGNQLLAVDPESGAVTLMLDNTTQSYNSLEFSESGGLLLVKESLNFHLFDGADGALRGKWSWPLQKNYQMPHLCADGRIATVEWVFEYEGPMYLQKFTGRHRLIARWYRLDPAPVLTDSLVSPWLEKDYKHLTTLNNGNELRFLDRQKMVLVRKQLNRAPHRDKLYVWDYSGRRDSLYTFTWQTNMFSNDNHIGFLDHGQGLTAILANYLYRFTYIGLEGGAPEYRVDSHNPMTGAEEILGLAVPSFERVGDINSDGGTDITDLLELLRALQSGASRPEFDLNFDGRFDIFDLLALLKRLAGR